MPPNRTDWPLAQKKPCAGCRSRASVLRRAPADNRPGVRRSGTRRTANGQFTPFYQPA